MNSLTFSHLDRDHKNPTMVDITQKRPTLRLAKAQLIMELPPEVLKRLHQGEIHTPKGPVFQTAIIAGTMAVKKTAELIPFCHSVAVESCQIQIEDNLEGRGLTLTCTVKGESKTGYEMEALMGAQVAGLTVYDMCKSVAKEMCLVELKLIEKRGGTKTESC